MESHLVLGLPPSYTKKTDPTINTSLVGGSAFRTLWGNIDSKKKEVKNTKLYPVKFTIGFPETTKIGAINSIIDVIKKDDSEDKTLDEKTKEFLELQEKKAADGLSSFKFGPATAKDGTNLYLETVGSMMQMLAYGNKVNGVDNSDNYLLNKEFTYIKNFDPTTLYPSITFLASEETTITESATTEVGDSLLKKFTDIGREVTRELSFVHASNPITVADLAGNIKSAMEVAGFEDNANTVSGMFADLAGGAMNLSDALLGQDITDAWLKGNQIFLPSVWKSSSFSKKYNIQIRLHTCYGNRYSVERNILVPLMYLLGFTLPLQKTASGVAYPYLVRVDAPGAFNIPMGIVTNLTVKKGGKHDLWSVDTLARAVDVNIEIADLYELLPAPADRRIGRFAKQTRNFVANMVGMSTPDDRTENEMELETFKAYYEEKEPVLPTSTNGSGIFDSVPIVGGKLNEMTAPYVDQIKDGASKVQSTIDSGIKSVSGSINSGLNSASSTVKGWFS